MSSRQNKQPLTIRMKPSIAKVLLIVFPHIMVLAILLIIITYSKLDLVYLFLSITIILFSFIYFARLHLNISLKRSINSLNKDSNKQWHVVYADGNRTKVTVLGSSFVSEWLILLNLKDESNKAMTALITFNCVTKDQYRALKVFINTNKLET